MENLLKYLNLILVLPDNRILLKRNIGAISKTWQWSATEESYLVESMDAAVEANRLLRNNYNIIPPVDPTDNSVRIKHVQPIKSLVGKFIIPLIAKINVHMNFQVDMTDQFLAVRFDDLLDDIMANSIYQKAGDFPLHTPVSVHTLKTCYNRRILKS